VTGQELGADEEEDGVGNVLRRAGAGERSALDEIGLPFRRIARHGNGAGSDGVDADSGSKFLGESAGEENDAGLGNGVGKKFGPAEEAAEIREINNGAAAGLREVRGSGLRAEEGRFEICVEGGIPNGFGGLAKFRFEEIGSGVYEDVEAVEFVDGARHEVLDFRDAREISVDGDGATAESLDFVNDLERFGFRFAVVDDDVGALGGKTKSDDAAKALPSPSDEGDTAKEIGGSGHEQVVLGKVTQSGDSRIVGSLK
jgi:hypothetical protein